MSATAPESAAARFAAGEPVIVSGVDGRAATVAVAGPLVDAQRLASLQTLGGDPTVLVLDHQHAARLGLAQLPQPTRQRHGIVAVMPVDALHGPDDAWSQRGRAHTIQVVSDPACEPSALASPGHVHCGVVAGDAGSAPALALELALAAGGPAAVALSAVIDAERRHLDLDEALREPRLAGVAVAPALQLRARAVARELDASAIECRLPTRDGTFRAVGHCSSEDGGTVFALVHGDPGRNPAGALVHTHVACMLGDTFGSLLCDCRERLRRATREIVAAGSGVIVYVKPALADPFDCPGGRAVDRALTLGALRGAGLAAIADERLVA